MLCIRFFLSARVANVLVKVTAALVRCPALCACNVIYVGLSRARARARVPTQQVLVIAGLTLLALGLGIGIGAGYSIGSDADSTTCSKPTQGPDCVAVGARSQDNASDATLLQTRGSESPSSNTTTQEGTARATPYAFGVTDWYRALKASPVTRTLTQQDFDAGTLRITKAGRYQLLEDIYFSPNSKERDSKHRYWPVTHTLI